MNNHNPEFLQIRVYFRTGLIKDLYLESSTDSTASDSWEYLSDNLTKLDTLYVSENSTTKGWWMRTSEIIFIERIG